jgi:hypothetical protein
MPEPPPRLEAHAGPATLLGERLYPRIPEESKEICADTLCEMYSLPN